MNEMIYLYDGSFHGFLCCIFESYAKKESPTAIACDEALSFTLFPTRNIATDSDHALRYCGRCGRSPPYAAELLQRGFLTCLAGK